MRHYIDLINEATSPHLGSSAFATWFDGSKVVDAHGKPLPVFHGTLEDFTTFKRDSKQRRAYGLNRLGYWFDVDPATPNYFADGGPMHAGNVIVAYLSIKRPLYFVSEPVSPDDQRAISHLISRKDWRGFNDFVERMDRRDSLDHLVQVIAERSAVSVRRGDPRFEALVEAYRLEAISEGYDGICLQHTLADGGTRNGHLTDWWIAFHPNQIKSVTGNNGRFDMASDDITD